MVNIMRKMNKCFIHFQTKIINIVHEVMFFSSILKYFTLLLTWIGWLWLRLSTWSDWRLGEPGSCFGRIRLRLRHGVETRTCLEIFDFSKLDSNYLIIICNYSDYLKPQKLFDYRLLIIWWLFCDELMQISIDHLMIIRNTLILIIWIISNCLIIVWFWLFEQHNYSHFFIQPLIIW